MMQLSTLLLAYVLLFISSSSAQLFDVEHFTKLGGSYITANISQLQKPSCQYLRERAEDKWCLGLVSNCFLHSVVRLQNNEARFDYSIMFDEHLFNSTFSKLTPFEQEWIVQNEINANAPYCGTSVTSHVDKRPSEYILTGPFPGDICNQMITRKDYAKGRVTVLECLLINRGTLGYDGKNIDKYEVTLRINPTKIQEDPDVTMRFVEELNSMYTECFNGYRK